MARTPAAEARRKAQQVTSASPRGSMTSRWPPVAEHGDWIAGRVVGWGARRRPYRPLPAVRQQIWG